MPTKRTHRRNRPSTSTLDLSPMVDRAMSMLRHSPRGASRQDILSAVGLRNSTWPALRRELEDTGLIHPVGRGPGLRFVHSEHLEAVPAPTRMQSFPAQRSQQLDHARAQLRQVLADEGSIDSAAAQEATGLRADPVRRLLMELVDEGLVERSGKKRSTRYAWRG